MALYIPHRIFNLARLLYVRPETFGPYYVVMSLTFDCTKLRLLKNKLILHGSLCPVKQFHPRYDCNLVRVKVRLCLCTPLMRMEEGWYSATDS